MKSILQMRIGLAFNPTFESLAPLARELARGLNLIKNPVGAFRWLRD